MPSQKDICIYALQHIGEFADMVSLDEDSTHAVVANTAYPFVRDSLLERHTWNFATRSLSLSPSTEKPLEDGWTAFPLPNDCIRVVDVYSGLPEDTPDYQIEIVGQTRCIVTPADKVWVRYVRKITNTELYSPGFVEALSWNLAAAVAGPIVKGETGISVTQKLTQYAQYFEQKAASIDAAQGRARKKEYMAPWLEPRLAPRPVSSKPTPMDERGDFKL